MSRASRRAFARHAIGDTVLVLAIGLAVVLGWLAG
jgi:hypothetical protein